MSVELRVRARSFMKWRCLTGHADYTRGMGIRQPCALGAVLALTAWNTSAASAEADAASRVEIRGRDLVGVDAGGATRWTLRFPTYSLLVGPVAVGGRTVVGAGRDLLEIDAASRAIVGRTTFPIEIQAIAAAADAGPDEPIVTLTLRSRASRFDASVTWPDGQIRHRLGDTPPRPWRAWLTDSFARGEASMIAHQGAAEEELAATEWPSLEWTDEPGRAGILAAAETREAADPTNVYLPALRARLLAVAGRHVEADAACAAAADHALTSWDELLNVSLILRHACRPEATARAVRRGLEGLALAHPEHRPQGRWVLPLVNNHLAGVDADGTFAWILRERDHAWNRIVAPVMVAGRVVYARRADLIEIDVARGVIGRRVRFPAQIAAIAPDPQAAGEPRLLVDLVANDIGREEMSLGQARYRLGDPAPGRANWGWNEISNHFLTLTDAELLVGRDFWSIPGMSQRHRDAALALLADREAQDPTNAFLPLYRGLLLADSGRDADAAAAYARAARNPGAPWNDLVMVANHLEAVGASADAAIAFENAIAAMKVEGIRAERLQSIDVPLLGSRWLKAIMAAALSGGDVERVHTIASRWATLAPRLELGHHLWRALARWMREHGRADLAAEWDRRAAYAAGGALNRYVARVIASAEWVGVVVVGLLAAVPLLVLVVGLRSRDLRRRLRDRLGDAAGPAWLPAIRPVDVAALLLPVAVALLLVAYVVPYTATMTDVFLNASGVSDDGVGDPRLVGWLEARPAGPARDETLAWARAEHVAALQGEVANVRVPDEATLAAALEPSMPFADRLELADTSIVSLLEDTPLEVLADQPGASPMRRWLVHIAWVSVVLVLGIAIAAAWPRAARWMAVALPGTAAPLGLLSGVMLGMFLAAILVVLGLAAMDLGSTYRLFGFEAIWSDPPGAPSRLCACAVIVVVTAIHVAAVRRDRARG
jgi:hypothetical protein